ncbi:hypothetical protein NX773_20340 [Massilia solisilvae]|uniref:Uncharacterized protein n=1 Tax=Massilia solisilvae TaxID=1811225 RepID=A0ABT2BPS8_9BURK|nr:hypothetical protein [Massilia solisilvae]MCS0610524.1 hypothetical protein [Massilia solisilvae]
MNRFDQVLGAIRANPVRFVAWMLALLVLAAAALTVFDGIGLDLWLFSH